MSKNWKNWAGTVSHQNLSEIHRPENLAELQAAVQEAAGGGVKVRAVGSGHSWSNLGLPSAGGAIVRLDKLTRVLGVQGNLVEVEAGITIERLNQELFARGLALPNMGDATPQAIAGAVSTETHGSGVTLGSLSEYVEGMRIVLANGEVRDLQAEELQAGRVSLGKLGVIYSVTLACEPSYFLTHDERLVDFRAEQASMAQLLSHRHLEYWFYPYTGKSLRIIRDKVDSTEERNPIGIFDHIGTFLSASYTQRKARTNPSDLPRFLRNAVNESTFPHVERQGPWHKILPGEANLWRKAVTTWTMEYQFPLARLFEAFDEMEASIALAEAKGVFVGAPVQIRFTRQSSRSMLTHYKWDPTVSFSISFFTGQEGVHTWLPELERRLIALEGLPHWGKMYYASPPTCACFETVRQRLDPTGVFASEQPLYVPAPNAFVDP